jgi:hypothetical protein
MRIDIAPKNPRGFPAVNMMYRGESILRIRGAVTGQIYQFSPLCPIQSVDRRDAPFIVQTRLLRTV